MTEPKVKNSAQVGTAWRDLEKICRKIHVRMYDAHDRVSARRYQRRLQQILEKLPANDLAILREEGLALLHELQDDFGQAIKHRKREIQLIERLHKSVERSIEKGDYDSSMGESILEGRTSATLNERRAILATLEQERVRSPGQASRRSRVPETVGINRKKHLAAPRG